MLVSKWPFLKYVVKRTPEYLLFGPLKCMCGSSLTELSIFQQIFEKKNFFSEGILGKIG